jgi:hypothetical protein
MVREHDVDGSRQCDKSLKQGGGTYKKTLGGPQQKTYPRKEG